jgi:hypothetical protein
VTSTAWVAVWNRDLATPVTGTPDSASRKGLLTGAIAVACATGRFRRKREEQRGPEHRMQPASCQCLTQEGRMTEQENTRKCLSALFKTPFSGTVLRIAAHLRKSCDTPQPVIKEQRLSWEN